MELNHIRTKLNHQLTYHPQVSDPVPEDWPKPPVMRSGNRGKYHGPHQTHPEQLVTVVETLQQRGIAPESTHSSPSAIAEEPTSPAPAQALHQEAAIHIKRLHTLAQKVNQLSADQEQLVGDIKMVESRLNHLRHRLPMTAEAGVDLPHVSLDEVVLATAIVDANSNVMMTGRVPHITQPEQEARDLADHLRGTYGPKYGPKSSSPISFSWSNLASDFGAVCQEPRMLLTQLWQYLKPLTQSVSSHPSKNNAERKRFSQSASWDALSLTDMLLWFGGGVIGRLALNLLLSAIPALWSLAVAILTGLTAYGLYRATLAPRRDFGLAYRIFLVIVGLLIGGRF
jgi:hypothetical protein